MSDNKLEKEDENIRQLAERYAAESAKIMNCYSDFENSLSEIKSELEYFKKEKVELETLMENFIREHLELSDKIEDAQNYLMELITLKRVKRIVENHEEDENTPEVQQILQKYGKEFFDKLPDYGENDVLVLKKLTNQSLLAMSSRMYFLTFAEELKKQVDSLPKESEIEKSYQPLNDLFGGITNAK